jgi:hypothetical protein
MSSYSPYTRHEKAIAAADRGGIRQRWEYARRLLCDPLATTPAGNLRNGVIAALIEAARKAGVKLSEREIQYRLRTGRTYPCASQITHICAAYESFGALRAADFPGVDAGPGEEPYDPRGAVEKARAIDQQLSLGGPEDPAQLPLFEWFPDDRFDELATLAELRKYAEESARWTERHARKDQERFEYLERLSAAVGGDENKTWEEAQAALDAHPPE